MADLSVSLAALLRKNAQKPLRWDMLKCTICFQKCATTSLERGDSLACVCEERFLRKVGASRILHSNHIARTVPTRSICHSFSMGGRLPFDLPVISCNGRKHRSDCEHVYVIHTSRVLSPDRTWPDRWLSEMHVHINILRGLPCWLESLRSKFTNEPSIFEDGDLAESIKRSASDQLGDLVPQVQVRTCPRFITAWRF